MKYVLVSACLLGIHCRYDGGNNSNKAVLSLLEDKDICLIPVCPEQLGGLPTPRLPSERSGKQVVNSSGTDVTDAFEKGAEEALQIARLYGCSTAILKERSPSCGCKSVYDGTFTHTLTDRNGYTAELLLKEGIRVLGENDIQSGILP